jgi:hypothetical protein
LRPSNNGRDHAEDDRMSKNANGSGKTQSGSNGKPAILKPSDFMRSNRPELFSDTTETADSELKRAQLEYFLDTLTSRRHEFAFEDFCRRLAEVELCPNLRPQTGPVGGGDSKTDSSTYPVAEILCDRTYWGTPNPPKRESWAFAFSCQKRWRQKMRDDLAKIAGLKKRFSTVCFMTNQFVTDKSRSEVEDEFSSQYGFAVHLYDRTWILNAVFKNKREELAIEALGIDVAKRPNRRPGPLDTGRQAELDELLARLRAPVQHYATDFSIAAAFLRAAKLARGLERPRHDVAGFFQQARRVSRLGGDLSQIIRCAYENAWADNWWYDDVSTAIEVYAEIEPFFRNIVDSRDVELFANLQNLMWQAVLRGEKTADELKLRKRRAALRAKLKKLSRDKLRPNNALDAATMHAFLDLEPWNKDPKQDALLRLADCFRRSRGMATYPLKRFTDTVTGMSEYIESLPGYDELFETMRKVLAEREGDIAEVELLLQRGTQHLKAGRTTDALRVLGQARIKAVKEEVLETCVRAAILAANAYMRLGLPWAARMEVLTAARLSCQIVENTFQSAFHGFHATRLLAWIELSQGRFAPFLRWITIASECFRQMVEADFDVSRFKDAHETLESSLCDRLILLTRATAHKLMPIANALHNFGFPMARFFLLYAAGRTGEIEEDFTTAFQENAAWMRKFFRQWKSHCTANAAHFKPIIGWDGEAATFATQISGIKFIIESPQDFGAISFSENLLGVIEAILALANLTKDAFVVDQVQIGVDIKDYGNNPPLPLIQMSSRTATIKLIWKPGVADWLASTDGDMIVDYFLAICRIVLEHASIHSGSGLKAKLAEWHKEGALDRALGTSPTMHAVDNLIGQDCYNLESCIRIAASEA